MQINMEAVVPYTKDANWGYGGFVVTPEKHCQIMYDHMRTIKAMSLLLFILPSFCSQFSPICILTCTVTYHTSFYSTRACNLLSFLLLIH